MSQNTWEMHHRWRRWLNKRIPPACSITLTQKSLFILPTKAGYCFLLMAVVIFLVGLNYRNNLSYGVAFFMFALFQVGLWQTWRNLAGITLTARHSTSVHAGQQATFVVSVRGHHRRSPMGVIVGWPDQNPVRIDPRRQSMDIQISHPTKTRGLLKPDRLRVETTYPLGLFRAWSWIALQQTALVWPELIPVEPRTSGSTQGEGHHNVPDGMDDFDGFRRYQPSDSAYQVDWKIWARSDESQQLLVRQFHSLVGDDLWLDIDTAPGRDIEEKLSWLASQCVVLSTRPTVWGLQLGSATIQPDEGRHHCEKCLNALAIYGTGVVL